MLIPEMYIESYSLLFDPSYDGSTKYLSSTVTNDVHDNKWHVELFWSQEKLTCVPVWV